MFHTSLYVRVLHRAGVKNTRVGATVETSAWTTVIFGFIISYIHPSTATTLFKTFDCSTINNLPDAAGESWLNMDVSEMCFTGAYFGHAVWVLIMIISFVFGFPMFIAFSLWFMSQVRRRPLARFFARFHS